MLRYAFLKSDFHPQLLILGEREDFIALASLLRDFADNPRDAIVPCVTGTAPETDAVLTLRLDPETPGLRLPADGRHFLWKLNADSARHFATLADKVAHEDSESSSEFLEIGDDLAEIPVKISRGEFEDDFLIVKS